MSNYRSNRTNSNNESNPTGSPDHLEWANRYTLVDSYERSVQESTSQKRLPASQAMQDILLEYFKAELLVVKNYKFRHNFLRLDSYDNIQKVRETFHPMKLVNSPNLSAKYFNNSVVAFARATSFDDIHKVASSNRGCQVWLMGA